MSIRGVILAGGKGTRMGELTKVTNKHLLPVGAYPMVYYPLKKLTGAGLQEILLVSGTEHMGDFVELLGSGKDHGCRMTYRVQDEAGGIAQALGLAEHFCMGSRSLVLLGDNIFRDPLISFLEKANSRPDWAWIGLKEVHDPGRYGVAELQGEQVISIEEKPKAPKSNYAVVGIYVYPPDVFSLIKTLKPSARGELEITDVNNYYLKQGRMGYSVLDGYWTDAGTLDSLDTANELVRKDPPRF
jgi:glucose-1-phosphate thymidylyltransferase